MPVRYQRSLSPGRSVSAVVGWNEEPTRRASGISGFTGSPTRPSAVLTQRFEPSRERKRPEPSVTPGSRRATENASPGVLLLVEVAVGGRNQVAGEPETQKELVALRAGPARPSTAEGGSA